MDWEMRVCVKLRVRMEAGKTIETIKKSRQEMVVTYTEIVVRETNGQISFTYFRETGKSGDTLNLENE